MISGIDDTRQYPTEDEFKILIPRLKDYFSLPERSKERKEMVDKTFNELGDKERWPQKKIRLWFNNNKTKFLNKTDRILTPQITPQFAIDPNIKPSFQVDEPEPTQNEDRPIETAEVQALRSSPNQFVLPQIPAKEEINTYFNLYVSEREETNEAEDDIPKLPEIPKEDLDFDTLDSLKFSHYNVLLDLSHRANSQIKKPDNDRLKMLFDIEIRFNEVLRQMHDQLKIDRISPINRNNQIATPSSFGVTRMLSITSESYAGKRHDQIQTLREKISDEILFEWPISRKIPKSIENNEPLLNFYKGKCQTNEEELTGIQCGCFSSQSKFAYVYKNRVNSSHTLKYGGKEISTGFFKEANSMVIDESDGKIWIQADCRLKSFSMETLEPIDNFEVGARCLAQSCICIWDQYIVVGTDRVISLWLKDQPGATNSSNPDTFKNNLNEEIARRQGLNFDLIDWSRGKKPHNTFCTTFNGRSPVTSICGLDGVLAVASDQYPTIHLMNERGKIVGRLILHVDGITSLSSKDGTILFSGSKDMTANEWDIKSLCSINQFFIHEGPIISLTHGNYFGHEFLFTGGGDNVIRGWDITGKRTIFEIRRDINNTKELTPKLIMFDTENAVLNVLFVNNELESMLFQNSQSSVWKQYRFDNIKQIV
ncbi:TIR domain-containing protein [Histomonas meleagridis]|uniref:TIR domain-containing protein n=1 Tax=Histomonas meleagridis TaxID=135588 RepID=UPI00355A6674|nr:TIR domain-containing protein [Histomonas meleagridis]KAH0799953.1 TIR domain-containing protein [Histomonas meleagridis]